jgi:hypothetical protein
VLLDHVRVSNSERVYMNSQCSDRLLRLSLLTSSALGSSISASLPCGCQGLDQLIQVMIGLGQAGDVGHVFDAGGFQLFAQRLAVVDHQIGAEAWPQSRVCGREAVPMTFRR